MKLLQKFQNKLLKCFESHTFSNLLKYIHMYTTTATLNYNNLNELYIFKKCSQFSVFSLPELKAQVSFSDCLHVVSLSVNCSHFHLLLQC